MTTWWVGHSCPTCGYTHPHNSFPLVGTEWTVNFHPGMLDDFAGSPDKLAQTLRSDRGFFFWWD